MNNIKPEKLESQGSQTVLSNSNDKLYYVCQEKEQINNTNYLFRRNGFSNLLVPQQNLVFPLEIDCEYKSEGLGCLASDDILYSTLNITTQMKHPLSGATHMFLHREIAAHYEEAGDKEKIRHIIVKSPFHIVDFLNAEGERADFEIDEEIHKLEEGQKDNRLPVFKLVLYSFFSLADVPKLFEDEALDYFKEATGHKKIQMNRRLVAKTGQWGKGWKAPFVLTLNDLQYRVIIDVIDTCAVHGNVSYKDFCANSGIKLAVKDEMQPWIKQMDRAYIKVPDLFDRYAKDDLRNYEALEKNAENMRAVWKELGIEEYFKLPALTIGKTVDDIFKSIIFKKMGVTPEQVSKTRGNDKFDQHEFFDRITARASAAYISTKVRGTDRKKMSLYVLAKCDGGRCRNAKPTLLSMKGCLVDIDIAGAYTAAMSQLKYPLGNPVLMDCQGVNLKKWLNKYGDDLVPRLWYARIKTKENLKYDHHLIPSWFGYKHKEEKKVVGTNEGIIRRQYEYTVEVDSGNNKILTRQIIDGALTHDILNAIMTEWPLKQQNDFFKKVEILAMGFYPKSLKVDSVDALKEAQKFHDKRQDYSNTRIKGVEIDHPIDCHAWTDFSLGEDFIDMIKVARKQYDKGEPLNALFKLIGNTAYGDSVSKHFKTSNVIVGNNITAMVRTMMYYTEMGLNLCGSITDGQIFDLNKVVHRARGKYLNLEKFPRLYAGKDRQITQGNICKIGKLNNQQHSYKSMTFTIDDMRYNLENPAERKAAESYINQSAYKHVQTVFPNNDLLNGTYKKLKAEKGKGLQYEEQKGNGIFEFEMKDFLTSSVHHGSANYQSSNINNEHTVKMRSYETKRNASDKTLKKEHVAYWIAPGPGHSTKRKLVFDYDYYKYRSPAEKLMEEIRLNPEKAKLHPDFVKEGMLKPNEWGNNYYNKWNECPYLNLGDTIMKTGKFGYWSLTQFTFICEEQYKKWHNFNDRLKNRWNVGIEQYFLDKTGKCVNYKEMVRFCDEKIREGVIDPADVFNKHRHDNRFERPHFIIDRAAALVRVKELIRDKQFPVRQDAYEYEEAEEYVD